MENGMILGIYLGGILPTFCALLILIKLGYGGWMTRGGVSSENPTAWDAFFTAIFWPIFLTAGIVMGLIMFAILGGNRFLKT